MNNDLGSVEQTGRVLGFYVGKKMNANAELLPQERGWLNRKITQARWVHAKAVVGAVVRSAPDHPLATIRRLHDIRETSLDSRALGVVASRPRTRIIIGR